MFRTFRAQLTLLAAALLTVAAALVGFVFADRITVETAFSLFSMSSFGAFGVFFTQDDAIKYLISVGLLDAGGGLKVQTKLKTADYTIVTGTDASGTIFTNRGAGGTVNFTLPAPSQSIAGTFYDFVVIAAQSLLVKTATADTLIADNDATADSLASSRIGTSMRVVCDGTSWIATLTSGVPQAAFAQTATVAT